MIKPLRVHFDQNCMNARGIDLQLQAIQELHDGGQIVLIANIRNRYELGDPQYDTQYKTAARQRLVRFEEATEYFRPGVSAFGSANGPPGAAFHSSTGPQPLNISDVWAIVFPGQRMPYGSGGDERKSVLDRGQNSLHDVMHIANAHDSGADVLLTHEKALLGARERLYAELALGPRIESPSEFLHRFPAPGRHGENPSR
jgi:hypothetical protein